MDSNFYNMIIAIFMGLIAVIVLLYLRKSDKYEKFTDIKIKDIEKKINLIEGDLSKYQREVDYVYSEVLSEVIISIIDSMAHIIKNYTHTGEKVIMLEYLTAEKKRVVNEIRKSELNGTMDKQKKALFYYTEKKLLNNEMCKYIKMLMDDNFIFKENLLLAKGVVSKCFECGLL